MTVTVSMPVYDDAGIEVDTATAILGDDQVTDVVAQAVRVIYAMRAKDDNSNNETQEELDLALGELEEALEVYSLIEEEKYYPANAF